MFKSIRHLLKPDVPTDKTRLYKNGDKLAEAQKAEPTTPKDMGLPPVRSIKVPPPNLQWDPEYAEWAKPLGDKLRAPVAKTALESREISNPIVKAIWAQLPAQPTIKTSVYRVPVPVPTHNNEEETPVEIEITRFGTAEQLDVASSRQSPQPAWLYLHGGGMVSLTVDIYAPQLACLAAESGVQVLGVEYRLAPENPFPTPITDCLAAFRWVSEHAAELGLDPARLGLMGDSAGGGLAVGMALMARDLGIGPPVARMLLIYPMLDDRSMTTLTETSPLTSFAIYPLETLRVCWDAYLGKDKACRPEADVSPYAAPARTPDVRGLPPTYMDVGNLDMFRDECAVLATRLAAADVDVEFHMFAGVPHGFESAAGISTTRRAVEGRLRFMRRL